MLALKILSVLFFIVAYAIMITIMIIFERDKPRNMIIWCMVFLLTSIVGGFIYLLFRIVFYLKRKSLVVKESEDAVFKSLIANEIYDNDISGEEFYEFNKMAFGAKLTTNNRYEILDSYKKFKESLLSSLNSATSYIILEITKINAKDFQDVKDILIAKSNKGVRVKLIYDRVNSRKFLNELKKSGVRVCRFSKHNTIGKVYSNLRNCVSIDGKCCYVGNMDIKNCELSGKHDCLSSFLKLTGDVAQEIDLSIHQDAIFATNKFIEYSAPKQEKYQSKCNIQFVSNEINNNIELLLIKAICTAKSSIQLQLKEFIPTESIMSLLRFAINSKISVKLMVPLKTTVFDKFYASRAYAKELALAGADVYLFDGYIRFNAITVDNDYVLCGSFIMDREHIANSLQNVLVLNDAKAVNHYNKIFELSIDNSYKIANAKYMLVRERFFKNFV